MDENEYKSVRSKLITKPCSFEKSILALKTQCGKATKRSIAEREVVMCASAQYAERCESWLTLLRQKSQFSLRNPEQVSVLPHAKEMKVQVGGILGLCKMLQKGTDELSFKPDVFEVLETCNERIGSFEHLPFTEIIREIVKFRLR